MRPYAAYTVWNHSVTSESFGTCNYNLGHPRSYNFFPRKSTDMDDAVWRWESFFLQLRSFLETSSREIETASEDYSYFVLERLHIAVRNLSHVRNVLESAPNTGIQFSDDERGALREYFTSVSELLGSVSSYSLQWEHHIDHLHATNNAYSVPAIVSRGRGRPRFEISRDQLEYPSFIPNIYPP